MGRGRCLAECDLCQEDVRALSRAVRAGRATAPDGLSTPGDHVWDAIAAEVAADHHTHARTTASASTASSQLHHAPRQRRRTRLALVVSALTAAAAAVAITLVIMIPRPVGIATASLDAFPDHPGARGTAELEREPNGTERVRVELDATVPADGFREVWLLTEDGTALVSLGVLDGSVGSFTVPGDVDTTRYSVVDISQEPTDGGAEHSGDSIVRGQLTRS